MTEKKTHDIYQWRYDKYNEREFKLSLDGINQRDYDFVTSNTGFRKLIVQEWMDKVLGELPVLQRVNPRNKSDLKVIPFDFVDEASEILEATLAYGFVFVVPEKKIDGVTYNVLTPDIAKQIEYVYNTGFERLLRLTYVTEDSVIVDISQGFVEQVKVKHIHTYDPITRWYRYETENMENSQVELVTVEQRDSMIPFLASTRNNKGIWEDANVLISDIDKTYSEMMLDMELSRKMVLLPENFVNEVGAKKGLSKTPMIDKGARIFRIYPTEADAENQKPIIFDGHFDPEPYINSMNMIAHEISFKTGFGKGYFSYDKIDGFKTATEVTAGRTDMNLAKTRINNILVNILKVMLTYKYSSTTTEDFIVSVADSIIEDTLTYKNKLFLDVTNGLINIEFYLKETYGVQDISEMMPDDNQEMMDKGGKNYSGVNGKIEQNVFTDNSDVKK